MSVSLCAFRLELAPHSIIPKNFCYLAPQYQQMMETNKESTEMVNHISANDGKNKSYLKYRGKREVHDITMETYQAEEDVTNVGSSGVKNKKPFIGGKMKTSPQNSSFDKELPSTSKENSPALIQQQSNENEPGTTGSEVSSLSSEIIEKKKFKDQVNFFSGNPFVEVTQGILHFYKENHMTSLEEGQPRSQLICILAIPAWLSCRDLLHFLAPCYPGIRSVRIVRDSTPNQYMALVLFRAQEEADEFYRTFNGTPYNSMESELCHLVYVSRVEMCGEAESECLGITGLPMAGHTELPTCTVCLERMDESVDGILTILCNHSFHGSCLAKWSDTTCPVCRYLQSPEIAADSYCFECKSCESLWICLICGHVGCGRYVEGHAYNHFLETQHCYAMQLGNSRVWDYVGDNFVHRLLQNKGDGKLVELEGTNNRQHASGKMHGMESDEKLDSVQLEYTYLLTSQLESQRIYFEGVVDRLEQQYRQEKDDCKERVKVLLKENEKLQHQLAVVNKEKHAFERKANQLSTKLSKVSSELQEEKEINRSLMRNQITWQQRVSTLEQDLVHLKEGKDKSIRDLQEQLQDVMFFLEAQEKIKNSELEGGQILLGPSSSRSSDISTSKGARNKKRGK